MDDHGVYRLFAPLWDDLRPEDAFNVKKPLLAHYTTVQTLERILTTNEVWFSNPLFMNDLEEVRFGLLEGNSLVIQSQEIGTACQTPERAHLFGHAFNHYVSRFDMEHLLDTYVFCMSEHAVEDNDGSLSMWRGYGANGNGVAIVFDTGQFNVLDTSPLIFARVSYASSDARRASLAGLISKFADLLKTFNVANEHMHVAAWALFERIQSFALFTKHHGFIEEKEWRVVYRPDRDQEKKLAQMFHYIVGPRGVEPKLRFKVQHIEGVTAPDLSLSKITERIILGPTISSPLSMAAMRRMLSLLNPDLMQKLRASTIPFRALG